MVVEQGNTLYVKNLSDKVKKHGKFILKTYDRFIIELKISLYFLFSQYGEVLDIVTKKTKSMRGQAFVVFDREEDAAQAMKNLQNFNIFDKNIVSRTLPHIQNPQKIDIHGCVPSFKTSNIV